MKKFLSIFVLTVMFFAIGCDLPADSTWSQGQENRKKTASEQVQNLQNAMTAYPTPKVNNFLERKTISEWTKRWDKPSILTYCYIFIGQNCIGYFITNGKPASTQSYLIPEDYDLYDTSSSKVHLVRQAPDLDGTYGSNNAGYRFFLANGTAVECSGTMVSCVYADAPLSINCPQITAIKK